MNCERAEGYLSAYLDDALDSALRTEVAAHVGSCARCKAVLDDYRSFDMLLATTARVEPAPELRDRIFGSPEFAAILRDADRDDARTGERAAASDPAAEAAPIPLAERRRAAHAPPWARYLLPAAAALTVAVGATLLAKQGLLPLSGGTSGHGSGSTTTIGAPGTSAFPLSGGNRLVIERDGALWSLPERGGTPARLTAENVRIAGNWAVAPIGANGAQGGRLVAYVDAATGALHVVRADGLEDHIIARAASGALTAAQTDPVAARPVLAFSPDGKHLAYGQYVAGGFVLHVSMLDGSQNVPVTGDMIGLSPQARWSADGQMLAFTYLEKDGRESVWAYDTFSTQVRQLAYAADPTAETSGRRVSVLMSAPAARLGDPATFSWAAVDGTRIVGIFAQRFDRVDAPVRLTDDGESIAAASPTPDGAAWIVADGAAVSRVTLDPSGGQATRTRLLTAPAEVRDAAPATTGDALALRLANGDLALWTPTTGLAMLGHDADPRAPLAWSPDGKAVAALVGGHLLVTRPSSDGAPQTTNLGATESASAVRWAPDGKSLVVAGGPKPFLAAADGTSLIPMAGTAVEWSVAR